MKALLALECGVVRVNLIPSTVEHPNADLGVFAASTIWKGEVVRVYYSSLFYSVLAQH